ncbi:MULTISPECIES: AfsR/SARP family transcriptional regulator [unclassified Solwaraspora]|uniref:AfsR/SARP family transcriptional regulator n=1 Tax=unclassified Solwaraspora TaxID=2627926 RepID=UPI00259BEE83|nr:AfsR/SARP family transcriptional regulator [Solwaraspora sp. WMMA2056]WJK38415.1 AfsR/SARP family transcriptional regulator [Solwaraspora sp. WMMA2056]
MSDSLELRILGPLVVCKGDESVRIGGLRERAVLARLALDANRVVSVSRLIAAVWAGTPPRSARSQIAICVSRLRAALGERIGAAAADEQAIVTMSPGYLLRVAPERIDLHRFTELTGRARDCPDRELAAGLLVRALALWRGTPFEGMCGLQAEAAALEEARLEAAHAHVDLELELGHHDRVIMDLIPLVAEHPLRERSRAQLMLAQYRAGRRAESLRTYQEARRHLVEQVGLEPGPELKRLHDQILRDAPTLMPAARGLRSRAYGQPGDLLVREHAS